MNWAMSWAMRWAMRPVTRRVRLAARLVPVIAGIASPLLVADAGAAEPDVFTVAGVPVDATAANAVAAREAARLEGERRAVRILLERLTLAADQGRLPRVGDQALPNLVRNFEVAGERSSGVRYLAEYTFRFRPDGIRTLLRNAGVPFTETLSKPVVVLPVLHRADGVTVLWDDPNPWRDAWANRKVPDGLVPLAVPLGDVEDVAAIDADRAVAGDPKALAAIAARYDAGDALPAVATLQPTGELEVALRRVAPGGASAAILATVYKPNPGETPAALMDRAVAAGAVAVAEAWKRDTMLDASQQGTLTAQVPVGDLADWIAVRNRLGGIPAITGADLVSLAKDGASVTLHYLGDPDRLRLALAQHDLALTGIEGSWTLRPQSAGTAR
jgi:hypothetical protein